MSLTHCFYDIQMLNGHILLSLPHEMISAISRPIKLKNNSEQIHFFFHG